jgi:hypothetical protein
LYIACLLGRSPTSNKIVYLGLRIYLWQNPLKNQLWDESLPLFLYLTHIKRFILTFLMLSAYSVTFIYPPFFFCFLPTSYSGTLVYSICAYCYRKTPVLKQLTYAKLSRLKTYSSQYLLAYRRVDSIISLLFDRFYE